jgi:catechol 2,3-dioxygenase-like lactoylglutathione lyase family enzyme
MIHSIDHLSIATPDLAEAARDYEVLLGRKPDGAIEAEGARQVWFSTANLRLALIAPAGEGPLGEAARKRLGDKGEGLWEIAFAVDDLGKTTNLFERRALAPGAEFARSVEANGAAATLRAARLGVWTSLGIDIVLVEAPRRTGAKGGPASVGQLDHVVIRTPDPGRAVEFYGGRLGLDMRLDRTNPAWGARLIFFRCGDLVVEIVNELKGGVSDGPDSFGGLSWRANDLAAARERLVAAGVDMSELRIGRRPGSQVCTVRDHTRGVPTILLGLT